MEIESVRHKALRGFLETGKAKGLDARLVGRLQNMIAFLTPIDNHGQRQPVRCLKPQNVAMTCP